MKITKKLKKDIGFIVSIVFASAVVSGSLVFFGMQLSGVGGTMNESDLSVQIEKGIENYIEKKAAEAEDQQVKAAKQRAEKSKNVAKNVPLVSSSNDHLYGNANAKVTLIEYSDFQCSFCKRFHETSKALVKEYGDDVNWVYRHFPLSFHNPKATDQAMASECVAELGGNDKFWEYSDTLFATGTSDRDALVVAAVSMGIDKIKFKTCLESEKYLSKVEKDIDGGSKAGVNGTPGTFIVNNRTGDVLLIEGAQPSATFKKIIDDIL